jgi:hypothetical protein
MQKIKIALFVFISFLQVLTLSGISKNAVPDQDTLKENQTLYNGRIWRNLYSNIQEDQFLFSRDFLGGSVTIGNETFDGIRLKYDIFRDELLTPVENGIIQLNKELIDSFHFSFEDRTHWFIKALEDSTSEKSFFEVLYNGKSALYVRHIKRIDKMAVEGKYDKFYQINKVFVVKNNRLNLINRKRDLMKLIEDESVRVKDFLKKNKLTMSEKMPETFIPVLMFYDNLIR